MPLLPSVSSAHSPKEHPIPNTGNPFRPIAATRKVLIIVDKFGWSYDTIAKGLVKYQNDDRLVMDIMSIQDNLEDIERHHASYDLIFALGWTLIISKKPKERYRPLLPFLDRSKLITGIHSHRSWDGYASHPDFCPPPPEALLDELAKLKHINIISRRLFHIFQSAGLTNITLTENGVDTNLFKPTHPINTDRSRPLILGFSGSTAIPKHDVLKGCSAFILPLNELPNVQVNILGGRGEGQVPREAMPVLYNHIDLYICASSSEGFSQSVLEASACGRGVLSTRVGGCEDLIQEGRNGFFFNRHLPDIQDLVRKLEADRQLVKQLGDYNRRVVEERYSWAIRVKEWLRFIESNLPHPHPEPDSRATTKASHQ